MGQPGQLDVHRIATGATAQTGLADSHLLGLRCAIAMAVARHPAPRVFAA